MKTLKSFTLFTALLVLSSCSTSGNDSKNSGGIGGGGSSDPFLTAISKYSKMVDADPQGATELTITDGGRLLKDVDAGDFSFQKSISSTKAEYKSLHSSVPDDQRKTTFEIGADGTTVTADGGSLGLNVPLILTK